MKKVYGAIALFMIVAVVAAALGAAILTRYSEELSALKHDTSRWAVIQDVNGDRMAVEPFNDDVWSQLVQLSQNGSRRWVGGVVERYDNRWGFRFKPNTVNIAQVTAEDLQAMGLQATIRYISEHLDYWLNSWAYVGAKVLEVHS